jgi:hypothetical protein
LQGGQRPRWRANTNLFRPENAERQREFCHLEYWKKSLQTITDETGLGPVNIATPIGLDEDARAAERNPVLQTDDNVTAALDGERQKSEINYRSEQPLSSESLVSAVDNGPQPAANDNDRPARNNIVGGPTTYPLKEIFERGELGINEIENRRHWFDAGRFKQVHSDARGEPDNSSDDWRELMLEFFEGFFDNSVGSFVLDKGTGLSDDMEFEDSATPAHCEIVDNAGDNPTRDMAPQLRHLFAEQVVALMKDVLGGDYKVLHACIEQGWTARQVGETEGFKDRASASACGKGMIRSALRNLSRFYRCLDRIEERGDRPQDAWPLVGTLNWQPVKYTPARYRTLDLAFMNQAVGPIRRWNDGVRLAA